MVPLLITGIGAEPLGSIPNPRTRDGTWVTDMPRALRAETVARLNSTIGDLEHTNGVEMAVVVIRSLDGLLVEDAAVKLFQLWGIGKKGQDNRQRQEEPEGETHCETLVYFSKQIKYCFGPCTSMA